MPRISRFYFAMAITYLMIGIGVGLHMSIAQDHTAVGAHAHINLLGWVTSAVFGGYYALNPHKAEGWLPRAQCGLYSIGLIVMLPALYVMLTGTPGVEPAVAMGSMAVAAGVVLFAAVVFTPGRAAQSRKATTMLPAE
jgi:peptidoglycan/LPS O-acetylase OafA/YrhL